MDMHVMKDTHPYLPILSTGCQILAIGAEAYAADVEVAGSSRAFVDENAGATSQLQTDSYSKTRCPPCLPTGLHIEDLRCPIAPCRKELAIR